MPPLDPSSASLHFPRFDLSAARARINAAPELDRPRLWQESTLVWAESLRDALNVSLANAPPKRARYRLDSSPRLIVIAALPADVSAKWPPFGEWVLNTVLPFLAPIATIPPWPTVVCFIHDVATFDTYLRDVGRTKQLVPAGAYLSAKDVLPQIALLGVFPLLELRLYFTHELIHSVIHRPDLPLWIEEGICRHLEMNQLRMHNLVYLDHVDLRQARHWKQHNLESFWSGDSFRGEGASESYVLATRFVRRLLAETPQCFFDFVQRAHRNDSGNAASLAVFHRPLTDLAAEILGTGNWSPPPTAPADAPKQ